MVARLDYGQRGIFTNTLPDRGLVLDGGNISSNTMFDLQVGGISRFSVTKAGNPVIGSYLNSIAGGIILNSLNPTASLLGYHMNLNTFYFSPGNNPFVYNVGNAVLSVPLGGRYAWGLDASGNQADLLLFRDAANILAQRNSTSAQTSRIYGTYTDASNYERLSLSSNSTAAYIIAEEAGTGTARDLYLGANNATAMVIAANGNIGVGTISPLKTLQVGDTNVVSPTIMLYANEASGSPEIRFATRNNYDTFSVSIFTTGDPAFLSIGGRINSTTLRSNFKVYRDESTVEVPNNGSASTVKIFGSGVLNSSTLILGSPANDTGKNSRILFSGSTGSEGKAAIIYTPDGSGFNRGNLDLNTSNASDSASITTTNGNGIRISANGNVGIANTAPIHKLSVNGKFQLNVVDTYDSDHFRIVNGAHTFFFGSYPYNQRITYSAALSFIRGSAEHVTFDYDGNVGIGITAPTAKLALANGTSPTTQHIYGTYTDASNYERLNISANSTAAYITAEKAGTGTARPLYLGANNTTIFSLSTIGNIGITNPTANTIPFLYGTNGNYGSLLIGAGNNTVRNQPQIQFIGHDSQYNMGGTGGFVNLRAGSGFGAYNGAFVFEFWSSGSVLTERMRIEGANGNVGIGNTAPTNKLSVNGDVFVGNSTLNTVISSTTISLINIALVGF
jgi:hypothetical protein